MASGFRLGANKEKALLEKMSRLGIRQSDIIESFTRSGGPGGQNVNKTSTCVFLKHIPTGIEVKCQKERSQALNRYIGRCILLEKVQTLTLKKLAEQKQRIEKIKRQKRKKSRKAKLMILEEKRRHAEKKKLRVKIRDTEY